jgi:hypothetical protein
MNPSMLLEFTNSFIQIDGCHEQYIFNRVQFWDQEDVGGNASRAPNDFLERRPSIRRKSRLELLQALDRISHLVRPANTRVWEEVLRISIYGHVSTLQAGRPIVHPLTG